MSRPEPHPRPTAGLVQLVHAAADGDQEAWDALVDRFAGLVWSIARAHRLSATDAADVSQTTWLRLVEHLRPIRDPERGGAWIASTARHECLRVIRHAGRVVADGDRDLDAGATEPEALDILIADPPPSYEDIAETFGIPIGSIGPTRARCLDQLRRRPEIAGI